MPTKEPYPSDLTDAEWKLLEPLLPGPKKLGRPARYSRRLVLNAIFYVVCAAAVRGGFCPTICPRGG